MHQAIRALGTFAHSSHRWGEPWDNTRNDSRSDSWTVTCKRCNAQAVVYFEHPHDEPEIDPELTRTCIPFSVESGEDMAMMADIDALCRKYGQSKVEAYFNG